MKNLFWKIYSKIARVLIKYSSDPRPDSYPLISGDGFRKMAQHIYDETGKFDPNVVKRGDIVFLKTDMLDEYFVNIHPNIRFPYKLITHNSDRNITETEKKYLDKKIIKWFAQNVLISHEKIIPIPIGLENKWYMNAGIPWIYGKIQKESEIKTKTPALDNKTRIPKILVSFNVNTNLGLRERAFLDLKENPLVSLSMSWPDPYTYTNILSKYKYVASPPGNGFDCHRTWEALYLGTIPIVIRTTCTEYWKKLGLNIICVDSYSGLNIEQLEVEIEKNNTPKSFSILTADFWRTKIYEA